MESIDKQRARGSSTYRIVVRGELSERFSVAFEGMEVKPTGGRTIITGEVADQPHLHGILARVSALGLDLVSVHEVTGEGHAKATTH